MFWIISLICASISLVYLIVYLRENEYVKKEDLIFASEILNLSFKIIDELGLEKEKDIKKISKIIKKSIQFSIENFDNTDKRILINNAYEYTLELCKQANIEITKNRDEIIKSLVAIGINNL